MKQLEEFFKVLESLTIKFNSKLGENHILNLHHSELIFDSFNDGSITLTFELYGRETPIKIHWEIYLEEDMSKILSERLTSIDIYLMEIIENKDNLIKVIEIVLEENNKLKI